MNKALGIKMAIVLAIALVLNIPLAMIDSKSSERQRYYAKARHDIADSWTGEQKLIGPIVRIPYTYRVEKKVWDKEEKKYTTEVYFNKAMEWVVMDKSQIASTLNDQQRYIGIYKVPVYVSELSITGRFDHDALANLKARKNVTKIGKPVMSYLIADTRGVNRIPTLSVAGEQLDFQPGSDLKFDREGIHVELPKSVVEGKTPFVFDLSLRGMGGVEFYPVARQAEVSVQSPWQHPKFTGAFLPAKRHIDETGYKAQWLVTSFASNVEDKVKRCSEGNCDTAFLDSFGVEHVDPVNVYLQTERSLKYGFLFIALSFAAFFAIEMLKGLSIHGIQYLMVGLAIAVFYLLLLALSEHIQFAIAYLIAAVSCIALLHVYVSAVIKDQKQTLIFTSAFGLIYGFLYIIIQSEDYALLLGSILTFGALVIFMLTTRNVDWSKVGQKVTTMTKSKPEMTELTRNQE